MSRARYACGVKWKDKTSCSDPVIDMRDHRVTGSSRAAAEVLHCDYLNTVGSITLQLVWLNSDEPSGTTMSSDSKAV